jgi:hypothetical protein
MGHTFFAGFAVAAPTAFSTSPLTLVATLAFLAGAFFLVTPVGLAALVVVVFGARLAVVLALGFLVTVFLVAGASSTLGKTRGLEFPVAARVSLAIAICFILLAVIRAE